MSKAGESTFQIHLSWHNSILFNFIQQVNILTFLGIIL